MSWKLGICVVSFGLAWKREGVYRYLELCGKLVSSMVWKRFLAGWTESLSPMKTAGTSLKSCLHANTSMTASREELFSPFCMEPAPQTIRRQLWRQKCWCLTWQCRKTSKAVSYSSGFLVSRHHLREGVTDMGEEQNQMFHGTHNSPVALRTHIHSGLGKIFQELKVLWGLGGTRASRVSVSFTYTEPHLASPREIQSVWTSFLQGDFSNPSEEQGTGVSSCIGPVSPRLTGEMFIEMLRCLTLPTKNKGL